MGVMAATRKITWRREMYWDDGAVGSWEELLEAYCRERRSEAV